MPIEEKESYRWIENLRTATQLLKNPAHCVHIGDRENDIYEFFVKQIRLIHTLSSGSALTDWRLTASTEYPMK
jgi:hypothetical protein